MKYIIVAVIWLTSGSLGMLFEYGGIMEEPAYFWTMGGITGLLVGIVLAS